MDFSIGGMLITDSTPRPIQSGSRDVRVSVCGWFTKVVIVDYSLMVRVFVFLCATIHIGRESRCLPYEGSFIFGVSGENYLT
jgi:hypothetical protein